MCCMLHITLYFLDIVLLLYRYWYHIVPVSYFVCVLHKVLTPINPTTHATSAKLSYNWRLIVSGASMYPHIPITGLRCLSICAACDNMYVPFSRSHLLKSPCKTRLQPHPPISATVYHPIVAGWLPIPLRTVPWNTAQQTKSRVLQFRHDLTIQHTTAATKRTPRDMYGWSEDSHQITWIELWFMWFRLPRHGIAHQLCSF